MNNARFDKVTGWTPRIRWMNRHCWYFRVKRRLGWTDAIRIDRPVPSHRRSSDGRYHWVVYSGLDEDGPNAGTLSEGSAPSVRTAKALAHESYLLCLIEDQLERTS